MARDRFDEMARELCALDATRNPGAGTIASALRSTHEKARAELLAELAAQDQPVRCPCGEKYSSDSCRFEHNPVTNGSEFARGFARGHEKADREAEIRTLEWVLNLDGFDRVVECRRRLAEIRKGKP